jgi:hypothetical protein
MTTMAGGVQFMRSYRALPARCPYLQQADDSSRRRLAQGRGQRLLGVARNEANDSIRQATLHSAVNALPHCERHACLSNRVKEAMSIHACRPQQANLSWHARPHLHGCHRSLAARSLT